MRRPSFSPLVVATAAVAVAAVVGAIVLAAKVGGGAAPGNGQQAFDSPGCSPPTYAGPGRRPRLRSSPVCPTPQVVITDEVARTDHGWRVTWDGGQTYDPEGGLLTRFEWTFGGRAGRGRRVTVNYPRPGTFLTRLQVTDDGGLVGTAYAELNLPG